MKYLWHCRSCNERGQHEVPIESLLKKGQDLLTTLQEEVDHKCENKDIGVSVHDANKK